ncbi:Golgin subfamily A member 7/ERF4 family-domain-containing protein [Zychaea mexicana]|uniref:Golgin subfamily A member 7/ERF4 family-domain-containing protein n=1 Tax=Zychaea mexicana TaxID=64656 RepID=UPI0022FDF321|nr:Golgin subfamily A member 7/ERF4 family-domain-containing protein [Zychaea mexicana]KAI9494953.1 Golgin subfamily A member 7/ERF4 family-domain-containing protein [Zychaea mexicana]
MNREGKKLLCVEKREPLSFFYSFTLFYSCKHHTTYFNLKRVPMNSGVLKSRKGIGDQQEHNSHAIDACIHSSTKAAATTISAGIAASATTTTGRTAPLFSGKKRRRRHSAAIGSHSSALITNCSGTTFLRQHRKAFSLDTTPLLPDLYSLSSYDSNSLGAVTAVTSTPTTAVAKSNINNIPDCDRQQRQQLQYIETISLTKNNNCTTTNNNNTLSTTTTKSTPCTVTTAGSKANISNNTECNNHNAMATRSSMPPTSSPERHDSVDHQVIDISRRVPDKAIRVDRDYSRGDGITRFATDYPPLLAGRISSEQFQHTIDGINRLLEEAERVSWNAVFDNVMECLTIYTWPIFFSTHYQRCIRRLLAFIQSENESLYHQHDVSISNPIRCACLFLELKVYD